MKAFRKINSQNREIQSLQDAVAVPFAFLTQLELLGYNQIKDITLVANTPTPVAHLLNKPITGWTIIRKNTSADIWEPQSADQRLLWLEADNNVTISILVY